MKHAPCKNCERRKIGCHSSCKDYQEYARYREKALRNRAEDRDLVEYDRQSYNRNIRRLRNRFKGMGRYE